MRYARLLPLLLALCLLVVPAHAQEAVDIIYPSRVESTIVDGRDFYVIAGVPPGAKTATVRLLDADGTAVRTVYATDAPRFYLEYEKLNAFNTDQTDVYMPDLIYDPDDPDSLWDGSTKCYIKDGYLVAVVCGGYFKLDGRAYTDEHGVAYEPLKAGEYTLEVSAGGAVATETLTLGATPVKAMARFSPDRHLQSVTSAAGDIGMRTYFDPLPGYWSPSALLPVWAGDPYFAEIKDRWQLADSMEYLSGAVHFFVYNLTPTCATIAVELGRLQADGAIDTPRLRAYHYDVGEPLLGYADAETGAYLMGTFVPFEDGDRLALTRAEVTGEAQDNFYVAYEGEPRPIDVNVADGLSVPVGQTLTLFGVVKPIQNAPEDLTQLSESTWAIANRITDIAYTFVCDHKSWTEVKPVGLDRMLAEGWQGYSEYEFAHSFRFPDLHAGETVAVTVQGFDAHGAAVDGTAEAFVVTIAQ